MKTGKNIFNRKREEKTSDFVNEALKNSEARYRRLFETAQDGILIIDTDTERIIDVNPFLADLLGYARKDFIGQALWNFGPFKDILASRSAFQKLMSDGYIRYEYLPLETKDGRLIEVEFISNVYQVGKQRTIQCNIRDNSQRKQTERIQRRLEAQLKQAQKMEAVASLAGGIAHQFNNALGVIVGGLDLLEMNGFDPSSNEVVQHMKTSADKMSRLTRQLLAYARGGKYNLKWISLSDLVTDSLPLIRSVLKPSIAIETEFSSDLPLVYADMAQMQMVLLGIITNASDAIETQGRIRITCRKEMIGPEKAKDFAGLSPGIFVSLKITDTGKGMNEATLCRVFEPFFTTHYTGRGLGMAAVYGIVKNHDGWISIKSKVDYGTAVCIYLPAADPKID